MLIYKIKPLIEWVYFWAEELANLNKQLIQVIDILGRESKGLKNQPLFYIYDDGTVEKKIIIE